jgi:hypothetical protein
MTTPRDEFKPQKPPLPAITELEEELLRRVRIPEAELPPRRFVCGTPALYERFSDPDWNQLEPRPATDWLAVLGVGSAVIAFLLWAWPQQWGYFYFNGIFEAERLPFAAAFLALSFILLLLRRR